MMLKKHTKKITSVFNQCISFCFCISQLFLVDFIFASPPISLPTCSGSPIISCGTNLNRNTDLDSCSAVVNFVSPIGTSPCDGICSATNTTAIHIPDTTVVSSIININSFVAGSTLGGQVSLQSICLDISHAFVGQLNAALVSPSGNGVALFEKPGLGNNGCNGDSLSVCLIPGTGYGLNDTTACGNYPAYSGSYTGSDDLNFLNNGSSANGVWTLYIYDDSVGVEGTLVQWSLHFTTNTITTQTAGLPSGSVFPVGTTTNGFTALDGFGNSSTCSFNIVVTDTQRPKITCVNDTFSSTPTLCGKTGAVFTIPTTSDNCEIASAINNAPAFFPVGNSIVTWTITDIHGNTVSCFETVTVSDIENPMITCPGDVSVNASAGICSVPSVSLGLATASDNCGIDSITNNAPSIFTLGATTILWLVTDVNGNSATCNQTVTVIDNQAPTVSCSANITVNVAANSCGASVVLSNPTYADNCGVASVSNDAPATYFGGTTTVVWTVTDVNGNSSTCNQTVTVTDNIQPLITCPGNISGNTDAGQCTASNVVLGTASVSDNCGVQSLINNAPTIFNSGISTVTWTVTDVHSNSTSCAQTVTVIDNQAPTVSCSANVTVNVAANSCGASVVLSNPTSADNCGVASVLNNAPATYTGGITTVVWTVTDVNGNTSSCNQTVTITDNIQPLITCPGNISGNTDIGQCTASNVVLGTAIASDNCGVQSLINNAPTIFISGISTVTWTVTDVHSNSTSCSQTVTVIDNQNPTITCPSTLLVNNDAGLCSVSSLNLGTPITLDNCGVQSTTNNAPATFPLGNTTVIWSVTDVNGNSATCNQTVSVTDNQAPTVSCSANVTVNVAANSCGANVVLINPTSADNCGVASVLNNAPSTYTVGTTTVVWTVTDVNGNTSSCNQTVTVTDNILPTITCPVNISVNVDAGQCSASNINLGTANGTDNCSIASITNDAPLTFSVGTTTVSWTATDVNGNSNTCLQQVNVIDNIGPMIICPDTVMQNVDPGQCNASNINLGVATASGNCSISGITNNSTAIFNAGITVVVWTATDVNGNFSTCNQIVNVVEDESPIINCAANVNANNDAGTCGAVIALITPSASDNCSVVSIFNDAPATFQIGNTTVIWTATDAAGNAATCAQIITVSDVQVPNISCSTQNINANAGVCGLLNASLILPFVSDNCSITSVTNNAMDTLPIGINNLLWTVTDAHGNSATCAQTVTVIDNQSPIISCPADIFTNPNAGSCAASNLNLGTPIASDNCGIASTTNNAASAFGIGTTTVMWLVTDVNGNSSTCAQLVTVTDNILPTIICPNDVGVNIDSITCDASNVLLGNPNTSDNCGIALLTNDAPVIFSLGSTVITWSVTDVNGNTNTCMQNVLVIGGIDTSISVIGNMYTANAIGANYQWYDCAAGTTIIDSTAQSFTPSVSGSYALIVSRGGCIDTTACFSVIIIGLDNLQVNASLKVFPNPATEEVNVQVNGKIEGVAKLQLFDADGRLVREFTYENMSGNYPISLNNLAPSFYYLRVSSNQNSWNAKVLKVN